MSITIKSGNDVMEKMRQQLDQLELPAGVRQNGRPKVYEMRIALPSDPVARAAVQQATLTALEVTSAIAGNLSGASDWVAGALQDLFQQVPKEGPKLQLLVQVADVPIRTDSGGIGSTYRGSANISEVGAGA